MPSILELVPPDVAAQVQRMREDNLRVIEPEGADRDRDQ